MPPALPFESTIPNIRVDPAQLITERDYSDMSGRTSSMAYYPFKG